jgi:hypothetical protein
MGLPSSDLTCGRICLSACQSPTLSVDNCRDVGDSQTNSFGLPIPPPSVRSPHYAMLEINCSRQAARTVQDWPLRPSPINLNHFGVEIAGTYKQCYWGSGRSNIIGQRSRIPVSTRRWCIAGRSIAPSWVHFPVPSCTVPA